MSNAIDQYLNQILTLFQGHSTWWIIGLALVLTIIVRFIAAKLFKLVLNVLIFALIYLFVLLGLSYLIN